jgi:hypothetical protein
MHPLAEAREDMREPTETLPIHWVGDVLRGETHAVPTTRHLDNRDHAVDEVERLPRSAVVGGVHERRPLALDLAAVPLDVGVLFR